MKCYATTWLKAAKETAREHECIIDLNINEVYSIYIKQICRYCAAKAETFDYLFPLSDGAPLVLANVIICCNKCKVDKKNKDIIDFYKMGFITNDLLINIIRSNLTLNNNEKLRSYIFKLSERQYA